MCQLATGTGLGRRAHTSGANLLFQKLCVGENRKRPWDWPAMHFLKCLRPGAATRYWYAIRHTAERLTPLQAQSSLDCIPRFASIQGAQTIQGGQRCSNPRFRLRLAGRCEISGWETYGFTRRGLGEKSVPGKLAGMKGKPPLTAKSLSANTV